LSEDDRKAIIKAIRDQAGWSDTPAVRHQLLNRWLRGDGWSQERAQQFTGHMPLTSPESAAHDVFDGLREAELARGVNALAVLLGQLEFTNFTIEDQIKEIVARLGGVPVSSSPVTVPATIAATPAVAPPVTATPPVSSSVRGSTSLPELAELKKRLSEKKVVPVVGAGVSAATAGLPGWAGLIRYAVAYGRAHHASAGDLDDVDYLLTRGKLILAAEEVQKVLNDAGVFGAFLRHEFDNPAIRSKDLIQAIAALKAPLIATTNYDRLLEANIEGDVPSETWQDHESLQDLLHRFGVLHLHGVYTKPKTVILGAGDYARLGEQQAYKAFIQALWTGYTLLFIGCSLDGIQDPDLGRFLEWSKATFGTPTFPHYILLSSSEFDDERARKIRLLGVDIIDIGPNVSALPQWITDNLGGTGSTTAPHP